MGTGEILDLKIMTNQLDLVQFSDYSYFEIVSLGVLKFQNVNFENFRFLEKLFLKSQ